MNFSRFFILRPVATWLLMIALLCSGILAYRILPVSALPDVDYPTIRVYTFYPGASSEVMTSLITAPLERQFGQMPGLNQMTSTSSSGASLITLQFSLSLSLDVAEQQVQAAINGASTFLPTDLPTPPVYYKSNPADAPIMTLTLSSTSIPLSKVEDFAETLFMQKISQVSGVGFVSISGGQRPAVRVQINAQAIAAYGLSFEDIRLALVAANVNQPKGSFDGKDQSFSINSNDQLDSAEVYLPLIIGYKNGNPIRLQDIAHVKDSVENTRQAAWVNQKPSIILNIQRQPGANVIQVVDRIQHLLPALKSTLPAAVQVDVLADRTHTIRSSVFEAQTELMIAISLVVLVVFLFLRNGPATLIPSIAVPISLIGTFGLMYLMGYSVNNLTLMALVIATGFVVDDAIVMIENINRYLEEGDPPLQAALKGAKQIGFTILSLTISLVAVLIPLLFMEDMVGRLFREFAVTLALTILLSAFVSLSLTPMMCSAFLKPQHTVQESYLQKSLSEATQKMINGYEKTLKWAFDHPRFILSLAISSVIVTSFLYITIPKGFFPVQDAGVIQGISEAPGSISFQAMSIRQQQLVNSIEKDPDVAAVASFIGIDGTNMTLNSGRLQIILKDSENRQSSFQDVLDRLKRTAETVSGIRLYLQPLQDLTVDNRISRSQYQLSLGSPYEKDVTKWTQRLVNRLKQEPSLSEVASDGENKGLQTSIMIDRDRASQLGITIQDIDIALYNAFGQRHASTIFTQKNQYYVVIETSSKNQQSPQDLQHIYLKSASGNSIPLEAIAHISEKISPLVINRQGQFPVSLISFNISEGASLGEAVEIIQHAKKDIHMPENIVMNFEGAAKVFQSSLDNQGLLIVAALIVVYLVLGILYESYIHPLTILSTLPSAGIGALCALRLTGNDLNVISLIGIILLIGIVKKNAIMMIDFALEAERDFKKSPTEAIFQACLLRFRPILMTTLAALFGAIPLAFSQGMGAELRRPLGITIIGGLLVSQLLTLYTTPIIYLYFDRLSRWFKTTSFSLTDHPKKYIQNTLDKKEPQ